MKTENVEKNSKKFPTEKEFKEYYDKIADLDYEVRHSLGISGKYSHGVDRSFTYIQFTNRKVLYWLFKQIATNYFSPKLLDVGAGTGRIVLLAEFCGIPAHGIEFHKPYIEAGVKFLGISPEKLYHKDAFELDYKFLQNYNVIYTYMPIADFWEMSRLHLHMVKNAEYGTTFFEMLPQYYPMKNFAGERSNVGFLQKYYEGDSREHYCEIAGVTVFGGCGPM